MAPVPINVALYQPDGPFTLVQLRDTPTLAPDIRNGIYVLTILSCISIVCLVSMLGTIVYRLAKDWQNYPDHHPMIMVACLFFADLIQAIGFVISVRWAQLNEIVSPSSACFIQGYLINLGDTSSGSFAITICLATLYRLLRDRSISRLLFACIVFGAWALCLFLSSIGPAIKHSGANFYLQAGNWCWISEEYEPARLGLHYFWIFAFQLGVILVYPGLYFYLRWKTKQLRRNAAPGTEQAVERTIEKIRSVIRFLYIYPLIYVVLTSPLAIMRAMIMAGRKIPNKALIGAGCMMVSVGYADAIAYSWSRGVWRKRPARNVPAVTTTTVRPVESQAAPAPQCGRRRSGWSLYPGIRNHNTAAPRAATTVPLPPPASSAYSSRPQSNLINPNDSSNEELLGAREAGTPTQLAIALSSMNSAAASRGTPGLAMSPGLEHDIGTDEQHARDLSNISPFTIPTNFNHDSLVPVDEDVNARPVDASRWV